MKNVVRNLTLLASQINPRQVQFALLVVSLGLLVIGAGAPADGGGGNGGSGGG